MTDTTKLDYLIPEANLSYLTERVEKLNKRARKLGVAEIVVTIDSENTTLGEKRDEITDEVIRVIRWYPVTIEGQTPKFEGWTFLASLTPTPEGTLAAVTPGQTLPKEYYDADLSCDHCGHNRRRNLVYVVQHDDGRTKQVGSTCINDFLGGKNPHAIASWAELLREFVGGMGDMEDADRMPRGANIDEYGLESFLALTALVIRCVGWTSRGKARETMAYATVNTVIDLIHSHEDWADFVKRYGRVTDDDRNRANDAIAWAGEIPADDSNDYLRNIGVIARLGSIRGRFAGYAASIIIAHDKALERVREATDRPVSNHFGEIKKRYDLVLTVLGVSELEGYMGGTSYFYRLRDADGNMFIWFSSTNGTMKPGNTYNIRGTVKAHTDYKGTKQTKLTRCQSG
ncbi:MAG: hypothetical protein J3T61_03360 [Candidatus Brocadiales bacterium]|nr:hypothetical protein [Candidatus Bathyanammoxibius sp.]